MRPVVFSHVDKLLRLGGSAESGLAHRGGLSHKGDYRAVGGFTGIYIQHLDAFYRLNGGDNGVNDVFIASLAVIGNTFYKLFHWSQF